MLLAVCAFLDGALLLGKQSWVSALPQDTKREKERGGHGEDYHKLIGVSFPPEPPPSPGSDWHNPLDHPLPRAPDFTHYCLYGFGVDTEISYYYKKNPKNETLNNPYIIDTSVKGESIRYGVRYSDGDATVPLVSLGCAKNWAILLAGTLKDKEKTIELVKEYPHLMTASPSVAALLW